ncbi:MAG: dTDP-4-dehydrorhamnose reductase, partial [Bacteroidales bacterium]
DLSSSDSVKDYFEKHTFDVIINCAAYTAVDKAEDDYELCRIINAQAVGYLAKAAQRTGAKFVHVSTDYVFDGKNYKPYTETDPILPVSVYGKTKAEGEAIALGLCEQTLVIRTSWLYSGFGNNFVKTMLRLGQERERLNVVADQIGTPTYAADLAQAILQIVHGNLFVTGIFHFSNEGVCSWYDFTKAIHRMAGITTCEVMPIRSEQYPTRAERPFYSVLDKTKIKTTYGLMIPHWEESLERCIECLK